MCGIYGIAFRKPPAFDTGLALSRMAGVTRHRGPDDEGRHEDPPVALGMRRLSIIDVAGGHQPIANEDQSVWAVCNGEIYNFRELREELRIAGHRFASQSDSEVLVHAYEEFGEDFVRRIDGMYGFALWDRRRRRLLLGRDRLGIKPVYYLETPGFFAFASEAKALTRLPGIGVEPDRDAVAEYLTLGYVPAPLSMFKGIRKLPPATLLVWEQGAIQTRRYWELGSARIPQMDAREWPATLRTEMERAVVSQMVSDVPLGAFLSGGVDSSAVVAFMARNSSLPVRTYSIGFEGGPEARLYDELPYARRVAQHFRTEHHEIVVRPDACALLPKLLWHLDEPVCDSAFITTFLVSEFARREVTVILSGVGGDEIFGGYTRYLGEHYLSRYQRLPRWLRKHVIKPIASLLPSDRHSKLLNYSRLARSFVLSSELTGVERYQSYVGVCRGRQLEELLSLEEAGPSPTLATAFALARARDPLHECMRVDIATQLPDDLLMLTDRMSMATSLECRVPLLDTRLVEVADAMPSALKVSGRALKVAMKQALRGVLPDEILDRGKRGFGAPVGAWLKRDLQPLVDMVLSPARLASRGLVDPATVERIVRDHRANREDHTDHLLALINLELWCSLYIDGRPHDELTDSILSRAA
jgi:asparagine synthase (glutamine-hydrolysing)